MNVILFGFTGLGNAVLRGLLKIEDVNVKSVYTKKYPAAYPFYPEIQIEELCRNNGIKCFNDLKVNSPGTIAAINDESPDLLIVSSFNQIFSKQLIEIPKLGCINFHPSLLPLYRGPCPEQSVLLNGEKETGITVHYIAQKIDAGNILLQKKIPIDENVNYPSLKKTVAEATEAVTPEVITLFSDGSIPEGIKQDESKATYHKRPSDDDCHLENEKDVSAIKRKIRALNPFPGTSILFEGNRIEVDRFELPGNNSFVSGFINADDYIDMRLDAEVIRLFKKK